MEENQVKLTASFNDKDFKALFRDILKRNRFDEAKYLEENELTIRKVEFSSLLELLQKLKMKFQVDFEKNVIQVWPVLSAKALKEQLKLEEEERRVGEVKKQQEEVIGTTGTTETGTGKGNLNDIGDSNTGEGDDPF